MSEGAAKGKGLQSTVMAAIHAMTPTGGTKKSCSGAHGEHEHHSDDEGHFIDAAPPEKQFLWRTASLRAAHKAARDKYEAHGGKDENEPAPEPEPSGAAAGDSEQDEDDKAEEEALRWLFDEFDTDSSGTLDLLKLQVALQEVMQEGPTGACFKTPLLHLLMEEAQGGKALDFAAFRKIAGRIPNGRQSLSLALDQIDVQGILATELLRATRSKGNDASTAFARTDADVVQGALNRCFEKIEAAVLGLHADMKEAHESESDPSNNEKFASSFQGKFGNLDLFFGGLDKYIGIPNPRVLKGMMEEHNLRKDSQGTFVANNYGHTETTPSIEWEFVFRPRKGKHYPGEKSAANEHGRRRQSLRHLLMSEQVLLANLTVEELVALVLYTGPMFVKYNARLRNFPAAEVERLKGNGYVCTIHAIVSGINKISRITSLPKDRCVYRGLGGMTLPPAFHRESKYGSRGGVEFGFMSTTTNKEVAIQYSGKPGQMSIIFQINLGQVDRGASIAFLSQYPGEAEILMPPLSSLEVVGSPKFLSIKGKGLVMVYELRLNCNILSGTLESYLCARKTLVHELIKNMIPETGFLLKRLLTVRPENQLETMLDSLKTLTSKMAARDPEWFNEDLNLRNCIHTAVDTKTGLERKRRLIMDLEVVTGKEAVVVPSDDEEHEDADLVRSEVDHKVLAVVECNPAVMARIIELLPDIDFASPGYVARVLSGFADARWTEIANGSLDGIPEDLTIHQVQLAWMCISKVQAESADQDRRVSLRMPAKEGDENHQTAVIRHVRRTVENLTTGVDPIKLARGMPAGDTAVCNFCEEDYGMDLAKIVAPLVRERENLKVINICDRSGSVIGRQIIPIGDMKNGLAELDLSGCGFGLSAALLLAGSLAEATALKKLDIRANDNMLPEGEEAIAQAISKLSNLAWFNGLEPDMTASEWDLTTHIPKIDASASGSSWVSVSAPEGAAPAVGEDAPPQQVPGGEAQQPPPAAPQPGGGGMSALEAELAAMFGAAPPPDEPQGPTISDCLCALRLYEQAFLVARVTAHTSLESLNGLKISADIDWGMDPEEKQNVSKRIAKWSGQAEYGAAAAMAFIANRLRAVPTDEVVFSGCVSTIGRALCTAISRAPGCLAEVSVLDLTKAGVGDRGCFILASSIAHAATLNKLMLTANAITYEGAACIAAAASPSLETLQMQYNSLACAGCAPIASLLASAPFITDINLSNNKIGITGAESLAHGLKALEALAKLDMSGNEIGDEGCASIAEAITAQPLQKLDLSQNKCTDDACEALSRSLSGSTAVERLVINLKQNDIATRGCVALSKLLASGINLTALNLTTNRVENPGCTALAKGLSHSTALRILFLADCQIGEPGVVALAEGVGEESSLQWCKLEDNEDLEEGCEALQKLEEALPPGARIEVGPGEAAWG